MSTTPVTLTLSTDRKVCPTVRRQGSKFAPNLHNAYGLLAGASCPERTPFCDSCYAQSAERYPSIAALLQRNLEAHKAAGSSVARHVDLLEAAMRTYRLEVDRLEAAGRITAADRIFRIHWDGDFYSSTYTRAWAIVIARNTDVTYWAYTRSTRYVKHLEGLPNLSLYLSVDKYNVYRMRRTLQANPWAHVAYCGTDAAEVRDIVDMLGIDAHTAPRPCPENVGRIPLVMHQSRRRTLEVEVGTDGIGACSACRLCVDGLQDVTFTTTGR